MNVTRQCRVKVITTGKLTLFDIVLLTVKECSTILCLCTYVCMCVRMYVCIMCVRINVCMYLFIYAQFNKNTVSICY